jgi:hypothetical protein
VERGLTALIPCHTEHCAVFAAPLHRDSTDTTQSIVLEGVDGIAHAAGGSRTEDSPTALSDWSQLRDLRLIQPAAQDNRNLSVIAGHFDFYTPYTVLPQCASTERNADTAAADAHPATQTWSTHVLSTADPSTPDMITLPSMPSQPGCAVSCFTVGRHPVDRAISYYYQRFYQRPDGDGNSTAHQQATSGESATAEDRPLAQRMINELTPAQLEQIALATREGMDSHFFPDVKVFIDEGMSDAACAAVLGLKFTTGRVAEAISLPPEIPTALYPQARQNIQQCVIGLQERWKETLQVLDHWFPWMDYSEDPTRKKMSLYSGIERRGTLRPELYDVLVRLNPCDMMLYEEMVRLFDRQICLLNEKYYG